MKERKWLRWLDFLISIAVLGLVTVAGYFGFVSLTAAREKGKDREPDPKDRTPVAVCVAKAERRKLTPRFEVVGTVVAVPERFSTLTAATSGQIEKLVASEGQKVKKGDLIIQLDERPAKTALNKAEATYTRLIAKPRTEELAQAHALVAKMKAAHTLAENRLKRSKDLRSRSPDLVSEVQILDDQRNEQAAKAEWDTAEAQLQLLIKGPREEVRREAAVEVAAAKLQLEYCRVVAPFDGEVVEIKTRVGQRADTGTPLATILDSSEVLVQARVPSNRLSGVWRALQTATQDTATIHCLSFPDEVFQAKTGWLNQQTEALTSDVQVKLRVPNPKGLLRVGMSVQVELFEPPIDCIAVPEAAISVNEEGHRVVTVIKDGKVVPTEIEISSNTEQEIRAGGWVRVLKGLNADDVVAVENGYALPKDCPVTIQPSRPRTSGLSHRGTHE